MASTAPPASNASAVPEIIELRDSRNALSSSLLASPHAGGRLMRWCVDGREVIHWPGTFDLNAPARIRGGNPLLFPFIGRHRVGDQPGQWQDAEGVIHPLPQHGFARDLPFTHAISADGRAISMSLTSGPATREGYPFEFVFLATYRLDGNALDVELETSNIGDAPMPYYAGHHFYFHLPHGKRSESELHLPPTQRCMQLPDGSISAPELEEDRYVPGDPAIQDRFHVLEPAGEQNTTAGRVITLNTPSLGRRITIELDTPGSVPWYALTTWTESDTSDFYCVEPWLGLPNAIHHGQGLRWLAPGQSESARCRIVADFTA
jgi:galactose mutarotase-like enzyme